MCFYVKLHARYFASTSLKMLKTCDYIKWTLKILYSIDKNLESYFIFFITVYSLKDRQKMLNSLQKNHARLFLILTYEVAVAFRHSCLTVFAWRRVVLRFSTRNNCCEFLAFYGVNTQSVIQSYIYVFKIPWMWNKFLFFNCENFHYAFMTNKNLSDISIFCIFS